MLGYVLGHPKTWSKFDRQVFSQLRFSRSGTPNRRHASLHGRSPSLTKPFSSHFSRTAIRPTATLREFSESAASASVPVSQETPRGCRSPSRLFFDNDNDDRS